MTAGRTRGLVLEGIAVCVAAVGLGWGLGVPGRGADVETVLGVLVPAYLLTAVLLVGALLLRADGEGRRRRLAALGADAGWVEIRQGVLAGAFGLVALGLLGWVLQAALGVSLAPPAAEADGGGIPPAVELMRSHPWTSLTVATAAGAVEEVLYRGWGVLLVRRARPSLTVPALVASSLLFGAAHHLIPVGAFVGYALLGLVFGGAALASGSVLPAVIVHAGMNAAVVAAVAFGG